jgi:putative MATE family efflux protein
LNADEAAALGTRPIGGLLWSSSSQSTIAVATYGIYALTNAWFVSRGVGSIAFAAVNLVAPVLMILGAVTTTVGAGGASLVSRSLGLGDLRQAARATGTAFVVYWTTAIVITVVGLVFLDPLLTLLGATDETRGYAHDYGWVILAGSITATGFSSLVRAEGRMRFATMLWVVPVVCQIVLDPVLIFGFDLGVLGAALGTVGGQAVSAGMSLWFFFVRRDRPYRVTLADLRPHGPTLRQLVGVGAPSFLGGVGATLVVALVNNLLVVLGGPVLMSAYAICARIGTFVLMPQLGISQGMQPLIGYNAGRGLTDRVDRTRTLAVRASVVYGTVACLGILAAAGPLVAVFTDDQAVRTAATDALRVLALAYPLAGVAILVSAYFQAIGRALPSYVISTGSIIAIRVPFPLVFGLFGVGWLWISFPVAELVVACAALAILRTVGGGRPAWRPPPFPRRVRSR